MKKGVKTLTQDFSDLEMKQDYTNPFLSKYTPKHTQKTSMPFDELIISSGDECDLPDEIQYRCLNGLNTSNDFCLP